MSGDFIETNRHGIFKETSETPGSYERGEGGRTVLPEVSGKGGFGGPGEYKKYPSVRVEEYETDEHGSLKQTGEKVLEEVDFLSSPSKDDLGAPGKTSPEAEKIPSKPKKKVTRKKKVEEVPEQIHVEEHKTQIPVTFKGIFGEFQAMYEEVFKQGVSLVLISNPNVSFTYTPPEMKEPLTVNVDGYEYEAYSVGIGFNMPDSNKKVTVLLVDEDD